MRTCTRRRFLRTLAAAPFGAACGTLFHACSSGKMEAETFIAKASGYGGDLARIILDGLGELRVTPEEIRGKRILLKANIVEPHRGAEHIVTDPSVAAAAAEAFLNRSSLEN